MAWGDSSERGSAETVLNSPIISFPFFQTNPNLKQEEWMSDGYLDSIYGLSLGAHAEEKLTPPVYNTVTVDEIEDESEQEYRDREKLEDGDSILQSVIPEEWLQDKHFVRGSHGNQMDVALQITTLDTQRPLSVTALLDTGCTGSSINANFVKKNGINTRKLYAPIPVYNADGSHNTGGPITDYVELHVKVQDHAERMMFAVTDLGKSKIFLGYDWLIAHNPSIDWVKETIAFDRCPSSCGHKINSVHIEEAIEINLDDNSAMDTEPNDPEDHLEDGDRTFLLDYGEYLGLNRHFRQTTNDHFQEASIKNGKAHVNTSTHPCECVICQRNAKNVEHIRAKGTTAMELASDHFAKQKAKSFEEIVPEHYRDFKDVFDKKDFDRLRIANHGTTLLN